MCARRAVVLAGGGSRGAYQIGVWRAMQELGISYQIVTGTSVGALNGAMLVQGDYEPARRMWLRLTAKDIANVDLEAAQQSADPTRAVYLQFLHQAVAGGGVDISGLEAIMRSVVDEERFYRSPVDFGLITVEYPTLRPAAMHKADIPRGRLCDYLIASASCFPAFPTKLIDDTQFIDGGYHDNLPINLALELGAEEVIAVDLESVGLRQKTKEGSAPVTVIRPEHPLGPFLLFEPESAGRNMALGYLDALRAFGKAQGGYLTFAMGQAELLLQEVSPALEKAGSLLEEGPRLALRRWREGKGRFMQTLQNLGEWYGLDPTLLYTAHSFSYELLLRFNAEEARPLEKAAALFSQPGPPIQRAQQLSELGHQQACTFIFSRLRDAALGFGDKRELQWLSAILQNETDAALFLFALKRALAAGETERL